MSKLRQASRLVFFMGLIFSLGSVFSLVDLVTQIFYIDGSIEHVTLEMVLEFILSGGIGVFCFVSAQGIKNGKSWGKVTGAIIGVCLLLIFPVGTIIGPIILYCLKVGFDQSQVCS